jgi:hypothetical protein
MGSFVSTRARYRNVDKSRCVIYNGTKLDFRYQIFGTKCNGTKFFGTKFKMVSPSVEPEIAKQIFGTKYEK